MFFLFSLKHQQKQCSTSIASISFSFSSTATAVLCSQKCPKKKDGTFRISRSTVFGKAVASTIRINRPNANNKLVDERTLVSTTFELLISLFNHNEF